MDKVCNFRFDFYPLDSHICNLIIGTSYDPKSVRLAEMKFGHRTEHKNVVLEYSVDMAIIEVGEVSSRCWIDLHI